MSVYSIFTCDGRPRVMHAAREGAAETVCGLPIGIGSGLVRDGDYSRPHVQCPRCWDDVRAGKCDDVETMPSDPAPARAVSTSRVTFERATEDGSYVARVGGEDVALIVRSYDAGAHKWRVEGGALYFTLRAAKDAVRARFEGRAETATAVLVSELSDDLHVTMGEAREVVAWCREWAADCEWVEDVEEIAGMSDAAVLRACHRHIDGGLADVLSDVRYCAAHGFDVAEHVDTLSTHEECAAPKRYYVLDTEGDGGIIGEYVGTEEDAIAYYPARRLGSDGGAYYVPVDCVEVVDAETAAHVDRLRRAEVLSVAHVRAARILDDLGIGEDDSRRTAALRLAKSLAALAEDKYDRARGMARLALDSLDRVDR